MLAIEKVVLLLILLIVLVIIFILVFGVGKPPIDKLLLQSELNQCCGSYRAYDCNADPTTIYCNDKTIEDLRIDLDLSNAQLKLTCNCP
jgi:hypothetical protein